MKATPTKLKDDSWGVRVTGMVSVGDRVTVQTKTGKTWEAEVSEVVSTFDWEGERVSLCRTLSDKRGSGKPRHASGCTCSCEACRSCEHKQPKEPRDAFEDF